ncbi:hypothetical protein N7527_003882 [Penicillium freii]|nr:hypothetical protein N7527_003882 [Penicillium freii]
MPPLVFELGVARLFRDQPYVFAEMGTDKGVVGGEYRYKWDAVGPYEDWVAHRSPVGVYVSGTIEVGWPFSVAVPGGDDILTNDQKDLRGAHGFR